MRKLHSAELKAKVLAEVKEGALSIPKIADKHGLNNSIIYAWLGRTKGKKPAFAPKNLVGNALPLDQRIAVLKDIESGMSTRGAAAKNGVNYNTAYGWTRAKKANFNGALETRKYAKNDDYLRDVSSYLRHSRTTVNEELRAGRIKNYDRSQLLMLLALSELEKNGH